MTNGREKMPAKPISFFELNIQQTISSLAVASDTHGSTNSTVSGYTECIILLRLDAHHLFTCPAETKEITSTSGLCAVRKNLQRFAKFCFFWLRAKS